MTLFYALLSVINTSHINDTFGRVAFLILHNLSKLKQYSINELSYFCNVSLTTISRFARLLDFDNLSILTGYLRYSKDEFIRNGQVITPLNCSDKETIQQYQSKVCSIAEEVAQINLELLKSIISKINDSDSVIFCGSVIPQSVTVFQMELILRNKKTTAFQYPSDQYESLKSLKEGDVVFIYDGITQSSITEDLLNIKTDATIVFFTSCENIALQHKLNNVILFTNRDISNNLLACDLLTNTILAFLQKTNQ